MGSNTRHTNRQVLVRTDFAAVSTWTASSAPSSNGSVSPFMALIFWIDPLPSQQPHALPQPRGPAFRISSATAAHATGAALRQPPSRRKCSGVSKGDERGGGGHRLARRERGLCTGHLLVLLWWCSVQLDTATPICVCVCGRLGSDVSRSGSPALSGGRVSPTLGVVRKERAPFLRYSFLHTLDCFAAPHLVGVRPSSHSVPPVRR